MKVDDIQILSSKEHVLKRPEMYVGQITEITKHKWIIEDNKLVFKEVKYIPAILKLFDEVITNSIDEAIKTSYKFANVIKIKLDENWIVVEDNGRGLTMEYDENYREYKAALAFIKLKAGSNFKENSTGTIGRFGVGVSLTNIFSKKFEMRTRNTNNEQLLLKCKDNLSSHMSKYTNTENKTSGTRIRFVVDNNYFNVSNTDIYFKFFEKRIGDLAMLFPFIKFVLNGKKVKTGHFKTYLNMIDREYICHENKHFKIAVLSNLEEANISFANGIETIRDGSHVDFALAPVLSKLSDMISKRTGFKARISDIKNNLMVVLAVKNIPNLKFDSQTKERVVNTPKEISDYLQIPETFFKKILKADFIVKPILDFYELKNKVQEKEQIRKTSKKLMRAKIPKLIDANNNNREECILFITEGDSAAGQMIKIRDISKHAVLPLRGKILNVHDVKAKTVLENKELKDIMAAIGLRMDLKANLEDLRYGKIVVLTDADEDGMSITALLLNFFYKYWPELFEMQIIERYLSPIVIAKKAGNIKRFYNLKDFSDQDLSDYKITYNKGLGGLEEVEYKKMIIDPIKEIFSAEDAKNIFQVVFGNDAQQRKDWLMGN